MSPAVDASFGGELDAVAGGVEIMAASYCGKGFVVTALNTVFHRHKALFCQGGYIVQLTLVDTVGTCADNKTCDFGVAERFVI